MAVYKKAIQFIREIPFKLPFLVSLSSPTMIFFSPKNNQCQVAQNQSGYFLLYTCKCYLYLSEEIIFQGCERESKRRKQGVSKTVFSRKTEYITLYL